MPSRTAILTVPKFEEISYRKLMANRRPASHPARPLANKFSVLKCAITLALASLVLAGIANAQSKLLPGIEVYGGYSHLTMPTGDLGLGSWTQMNGFAGSITIPHIVKGLGVTVDGSGNYATALKQYNYAVGAQYKWEFSRFNFIAHGLYGRSQTRLLHAGSTFLEPSDRQRAILFGGELDVPVTSRISWRAVQGDYVITSAFGSSMKSLRASTGLVYRFGKH
jgi:hypothetical protein